jgi:hypothetical protein
VVWLGWTTAAVVAFIVLISMLVIRIDVDYRRKGGDDRLQVTISALRGLVKVRKTVPALNWRPEARSVDVSEDGVREQRITLDTIRQSQQQLNRLKERVVHLLDIVKGFLAKVRCEHLQWYTALGTGDAAETGMLIGAAWGLKSTAVGWVSRYVQMKDVPNLAVTPDFYRTRLYTHFHCIVKFRLGEAILAGVKILLHIRKTEGTRDKIGSSA